MPGNDVGEVELSTVQLIFLSRYLGKEPIQKSGIAAKLKKVVSSSSKARKVRENNAQIKSDYIAYSKKKLEVDSLIRDLNTTYSEHFPQMPYVAQTVGDVSRYVLQLDLDVMKAPADAPIFAASTERLDGYAKQLATAGRVAARDLPALLVNQPEVSAVEAVVGKLRKRIELERTGVTGLALYDDQPALSPALVSQSITEDEDAEALETQRSTAVRGFDELHRKALDALAQIATEAGAQDIDVQGVTALEGRLTKAVSDLDKKRAPFIMSLLDIVEVLQGAARGELAERGVRDPVARREMVREAKAAETLVALDTGIEGLKGSIDELRQELAAATGFKQKKRIAKELKDAQGQKKSLQQRAAQLEAYNALTALRLEKMNASEQARTGTDELMSKFNGDLEEALDAWLNAGPGNEPRQIDPLSEEDGARFKGEGFASTEIEQRRTQFEASSNRVLVEARVFLIESDIKAISSAELQTLNGMLDAAQKLTDSGSVAEAKALVTDAVKLHGQFIGARNFSLPELLPPPEDPFEKLDKRIKSVGVELDRLWGAGGDADDALRGRLAAIVKQRQAVESQPDPDVDSVETALGELESDIQSAQIPTPSQEEVEKDRAARGEAKAAVNEMAAGLLAVHKTKQITESELGAVDRDHLIVWVNGEGETEYHVIDTKEDGTVDRRDDQHKNVPREAMQKLREQTQMLELLAQTDSVGCADLIAKATEEAQQLAADVIGKNEVYGEVLELIKSCDKLLADKLLKEWIPDGFGARSDEYAPFKQSYGGSMTPDAAKVQATSFLDAFTDFKQGAQQLKDYHKEVTGKLDKLETDMSAKKKGDEANVGAKLAALIKLDPSSFFDGVVSSPETTPQFLAAKEKIVAATEALAGLDKEFTGVHGALRDSLYEHRRALDTKSPAGIKSADDGAQELRTKMEGKLAELDRLLAAKSADPLAFVEGIASFLGDCKDGTQTAIEADRKVTAMAQEAKDAHAKISKWIKSNKGKHKNFTEYKSIYEGLESTYDAIADGYKTSHNPETALQEYTDARDNFNELYADVTDTQVVIVGKGSFDFDAWETKMTGAVQKVAEAGANVSKMLDGKYDDDERNGVAEADAAIAAVKDILGLSGDPKIKGSMNFKAGLADELEAINSLEGGDPDRSKRMAKLREDVLADTRRMRSRLESDPVLETYRNNPLDKGQSWIQLIATLLNMETVALKDLAP